MMEQDDISLHRADSEGPSDLNLNKDYTPKLPIMRHRRPRGIQNSKSRQPRPKIFHCPSCDRSFDRPSLLEQHSVTHTGEKPYVCTTCHEKRYTRASNLYRHMRVCQGPTATGKSEDGDSEEGIADDFDSPIEGESGLSSPRHSETSMPSPTTSSRTFEFGDGPPPPVLAPTVPPSAWKSSRRYTMPIIKLSAWNSKASAPPPAASVPVVPISQRVYFNRPHDFAVKGLAPAEGQQAVDWAASLAELAELARSAAASTFATSNQWENKTQSNDITRQHQRMEPAVAQSLRASAGSVDGVSGDPQAALSYYPSQTASPALSQSRRSNDDGLDAIPHELMGRSEWMPVSYYLGPFFEAPGSDPSTMPQLSDSNSQRAASLSHSHSSITQLPTSEPYHTVPSNSAPIATYRPRRPSDPSPLPPNANTNKLAPAFSSFAWDDHGDDRRGIDRHGRRQRGV